MRTNYPALVFVFLGVTLALVTLNKSYPPEKVPWKITGSLQTPSGQSLNWPEGQLILFPSEFEVDIGQRGTFEIQAMIEKGKGFEDVIRQIEYAHPDATAQIYPKQEVEKLEKDPNSSWLDHRAPHTWHFKPITVDIWEEPADDMD